MLHSWRVHGRAEVSTLNSGWLIWVTDQIHWLHQKAREAEVIRLAGIKMCSIKIIFPPLCPREISDSSHCQPASNIAVSRASLFTTICIFFLVLKHTWSYGQLCGPFSSSWGGLRLRPGVNKNLNCLRDLFSSNKLSKKSGKNKNLKIWPSNAFWWFHC